MAFRNIIVENPAHISVKNSQLVIRTDTEHSAALEDISALLLENRQATITTAALSALGECGCSACQRSLANVRVFWYNGEKENRRGDKNGTVAAG